VPQYIDLAIDSDPEDILNDAYTYMEAVVPGWTPADGQLDVWLLQSISSAASELKEIASAVPSSIFRWFGATLLQLPPNDATIATTTVRFDVQDNLGYTIPDGTQVSIDRTGDDTVAFSVVGDWVIFPGSTFITGVAIQAVEAGADGSGLGSIGGVVHLLDPISFVTAVTQEAVTSGGADAEDDTDYLNRLVADLQLLAPRPILANDFAVFARDIAGVFRATAIDGYNPADASFNNPRMVAMAVIDESGAAVSAPVKAAVAADLEARREINFVVNVIDPTFTLIDVTYQVKALVGFDLAQLVTDINTALQGYLSAASWGVPTNGDPHDWTNTTTVRYLEVAQLINSVDGVDYITTTAGNYDLQIGVHGGALGRVDIAMAGVAPLPNPGTMTGVAT
jgi:uncharacterized phage protein gp47/JayE